MKYFKKSLSFILCAALLAAFVPTCALGASSSYDLDFDQSAWLYNSTYDVYYQTGVVYCTDPYDTSYESFGIYVPAAYMNMTSNGGGTYTFNSFTDTAVGSYTAQTAPIVIPVNTSGYSAQSAPTGFSSGVTAYTSEGIIYLYAGCRGRDTTNGGAPWGVTDLKAAIRYYRYNSDSLPGNTDRIFTFGHSGGGAQSSLVGASGDSDLYYPYLYSIGAAGVEYDEATDTYSSTLSDATYGAMCWCPITSLDYADAAYEWMMGQYSSSGTRADGTWTALLSDDLSTAFAEYINSLTLVDESGNALTLSDDGDGIYTSGSYYDYILSRIEYSLNDFIDSYTDEDGNFSYSSSSSGGGSEDPGGDSSGPGGSSGAPSTPFSLFASGYTSASDYLLSIDENYGTDSAWIIYDETEERYTITSIEDFVLYGSKSASKDVGAFDDLNKSQAENYVFGSGANDPAHFDSCMASLLSENAAVYAAADSSVSESDILSYAEEYLDDCESYTASSLLNISSQYRQNMYNPMYYICQDYAGYGTSSIAPHWRINTGITQSDTSVTVETNLYLALCEDISDGTVSDVDFAMHWAQGHTEAERAGADSDECFIAWLEECISADESAEIAISSVSVTKGDTLTITVATAGEIDGIILAVGYSDGIVIDFAEVIDGTASLSNECETVKIFIWSTIPSLYPLCEYAEISP
ncbi:MAG: esterase [Clostridia bacterium]|nr:esterase [Clostridia bacterium]